MTVFFSKSYNVIKFWTKLKEFSEGKLTLFLLMTTQEALVDSVDQDHTVQNVQSDLGSTLSTFSSKIITKLLLHHAMEVYF